MVGQSSDVAVLALTMVPSTADVTVLMWLTDAFGSLCANPLPQETARPNPTAAASHARRAGSAPCLAMSGGMSGKKWRAESTCGKRVILFLPMTSHGSAAMVCRSQRWRQSNDDAKAKRENLCCHSF